MTDAVRTEVEQALGVPLTVISQGAEAVVFRSDIHPYMPIKGQFIVKYRPSKKYRHPKIDGNITKSRTVGEVRFMHRLAKVGIRAPRVILADFKAGYIWMELIGEVMDNGAVSSLKSYLWSFELAELAELAGELGPLGTAVNAVCQAVGRLIAKLHLQDMIHGDLTSSNIILEGKEPYLIDFGLSSYSGLAEDKAVDLYVLERAIQSTHSDYAHKYNEWMLEGYKQESGKKSKEVIGRLEDVRMRGRKRSMLG